MAIFRVVYTEKLVYTEDIDAATEEIAEQIWNKKLNSGCVDFSSEELVDSETEFEIIDDEYCFKMFDHNLKQVFSKSTAVYYVAKTPEQAKALKKFVFREFGLNYYDIDAGVYMIDKNLGLITTDKMIEALKDVNIHFEVNGGVGL